MLGNRTGSMLQALLAALLFGASAPLAKLLLGEIPPIARAGLLYLGSGMGVLVIKLLQGLNRASNEAHITRSEWKWLLGAVVAGGVGCSHHPIIQPSADTCFHCFTTA